VCARLNLPCPNILCEEETGVPGKDQDFTVIENWKISRHFRKYVSI
jgi:hypothetical protein